VEAAAAQPAQPAPKLLFPFLDLKAQFDAIRPELLAAVESTFESQSFILGPEVAQLESEIAQLTGCRFAIGCASGSDALLLALMALGVGVNDEVVTTPFTFGATAGSIARTGARPVFVDIDPGSYNIDPALIERAITSRTRVIMPVHLFGAPAAMEAIGDIAARRNIAIVEDAAQAIGASYRGAPVGSLGALGCFSFFPSKNLGAAGDGGIITTNDATFADRLRVLRVHGARHKYSYERIGMNSRLDSLQAAVLRVKLPHLAGWTALRQRNAARYTTMILSRGLERFVTLPVAPDGCTHVYNQFTIRTEHRDALRDHLRARGIPTEIYYPLPLHTEPAFLYLGYATGEFPQAERACQQALALPIFPELTEAQQSAVVDAIDEFFAPTSARTEER
jgi:dTDP-4-amino-4,6-dideoxygalactose transaminase